MSRQPVTGDVCPPGFWQRLWRRLGSKTTVGYPGGNKWLR